MYICNIKNLFDRAKELANRGTCLRRCYGALVVKEYETNPIIVGEGYNRAPFGCNICDECRRIKTDTPHNGGYHLQCSIHAEQVAIMDALKRLDPQSPDVPTLADHAIFLYGFNAATKEDLECSTPCVICAKMIIETGIKDIVTLGQNGEIMTTEVESIRW